MFGVSESQAVLIAPLWNWNSAKSTWRNFLWCSNRTFMELKLGIPSNLNRPIDCSNRTFMELKFGKWKRLRAKRNGSNRTFMELKCTSRDCSSTNCSVLIAPLWNWNTVLTIIIKNRVFVLIAPLWNWNYSTPLNWPTSKSSSNRTFMELKYCCHQHALTHLRKF